MDLTPKHKVIFNSKNHKYFDDSGKEYPNVTSILSFLNIIDSRFYDENSRNFGTILHQTTNLYDTNNLGEYDKRLDPWMDSYKQFLTKHKPEYDLIEQPMISKTWGFSGTVDRVYSNTSIDLKSGKKEPQHELQISAYNLLIEENYGIKIKKSYGLYLKNNGYEFLPLPDKRNVFLGLVLAYHWMKNNGY